MNRNLLVLFAAFLIIGVASGLRFHGLKVWSFNNDEIAEVRWASQPFADMIRDVRNDLVHPPLDYMLQHLLWRADASEMTRRLPSAIFGVATVALIIVLGRSWFSPAAGLAAGLLLAIAPMHVRYSQEVRPYASGVFFVLLALVALEQYAERRRRAWAVTWFVSVLLAGGTLYFAGMIAGFVSLVRIFIDRNENESLRTLWKRLPLIVLGWVLLYAPWMTVVLAVVKRNPAAPRDRLWVDWWLFRLHAFAAGDQNYERISIGSWFFWAAVAIGIALTVRIRLLRSAAAWFVVGTAMSILVLQLRPHYPTPRYLMPAVIGAFVLAGAAVAWLWSVKLLRGAAVMLLVVFAAYSSMTLERYFRLRTNWRGVTEFVYERVKPGDTVFLTNSWVIRNFGFYWLTMPQRKEVAVERFVTANREVAGPAWVVTANCGARPPLLAAGLMGEWPYTDFATVRYLRPGQRMHLNEPLCPEG